MSFTLSRRLRTAAPSCILRSVAVRFRYDDWIPSSSWRRPPRSNAEHSGSQVRWEAEGRALQVKSRRAKLSSFWAEPEGQESEQRANKVYVEVTSRAPDPDSGRLFTSDSIQRFTETLGAINTVGRFLVNMTRSYNEDSSEEDKEKEERPMEDVPGAIYTISKNVLGRNVTDTIAPIVRKFPLVTLNTGKVVVDNGRSCTTPDGGQGECDDLSSCPELLLDLSNLRQSICFKSLFVPGVCCPRKSDG